MPHPGTRTSRRTRRRREYIGGGFLAVWGFEVLTLVGGLLGCLRHGRFGWLDLRFLLYAGWCGDRGMAVMRTDGWMDCWIYASLYVSCGA